MSSVAEFEQHDGISFLSLVSVSTYQFEKSQSEMHYPKKEKASISGGSVLHIYDTFESSIKTHRRHTLTLYLLPDIIL